MVIIKSINIDPNFIMKSFKFQVLYKIVIVKLVIKIINIVLYIKLGTFILDFKFINPRSKRVCLNLKN